MCWVLLTMKSISQRCTSLNFVTMLFNSGWNTNGFHVDKCVVLIVVKAHCCASALYHCGDSHKVTYATFSRAQTWAHYLLIQTFFTLIRHCCSLSLQYCYVLMFTLLSLASEMGSCIPHHCSECLSQHNKRTGAAASEAEVRLSLRHVEWVSDRLADCYCAAVHPIMSTQVLCTAALLSCTFTLLTCLCGCIAILASLTTVVFSMWVFWDTLQKLYESLYVCDVSQQPCH